VVVLNRLCVSYVKIFTETLLKGITPFIPIVKSVFWLVTSRKPIKGFYEIEGLEEEVVVTSCFPSNII